MNITNLVLKLLENQEFTSKLLSFGNQTLKLIVPENLQQLEDYQALAGKKINFLLADSNLGITLVVNQGLELTLVSPDQPVDLEITLKKSALNKLLAKEADFEELIKSEEVVLEGNNQLLLHLANLSVRIDYSLENILAQYLGDELAYFMSKGADKLFQVGKDLLGFINGMGNSNSEVYQTNEDYFRDDSLEAQEERKRMQLELANPPSQENSQAKSITPLTSSNSTPESTAENPEAKAKTAVETNATEDQKANAETSFEARIEKTITNAFESSFGKDFEKRFEQSFEKAFEKSFESNFESSFEDKSKADSQASAANSTAHTQAEQAQTNQAYTDKSAHNSCSNKNYEHAPNVNPEAIAQEVFKAMTPVIEGVMQVFSSLKKK